MLSTKVAKNAGKKATFDDLFELTNIKQEILNEEVLVLEAHDADTLSTEILG